MKASESISNGVEHSRSYFGDTYTGTKEALIAADIVKPEWFPTAPVTWKHWRGGTCQRRTFKIGQFRRGLCMYAAVELRDCGGGTWRVEILCSEEERKRREESEKRELADRDVSERRAVLEKIVLEKVTREEIDDQQLSTIAKLWTLSERRWATLMDLIDGYLVFEAKRGELAVPQKPARRLELVVDNDPRRG